jgi:hypothetical protein
MSDLDLQLDELGAAMIELRAQLAALLREAERTNELLRAILAALDA